MDYYTGIKMNEVLIYATTKILWEEKEISWTQKSTDCMILLT